MTITSTRWMTAAACRGLTTGPGSVWIDPAAHNDQAISDALERCAACPVAGECHNDRGPYPTGIRGGIVYLTGAGAAGRDGVQKPARRVPCTCCARPFWTAAERLFCSTACIGRHAAYRRRLRREAGQP